MFGKLADKLSEVMRSLAGTSQLSEKNITPVLGTVRESLLDADVAVEAVDSFISSVKHKVIGADIPKGFTPEQFFVKQFKAQLTLLLGKQTEPLNLKAKPPIVILMAGLQGSGKTTTAAKLAKYLKDQDKTVLLVSCDVYRPAAILQLQLLAEQAGIDFFPSNEDQAPQNIAKQALSFASKKFYDVLLVDTAGRLGIDAQMMDEISALHKVLTPTETLFVVDSMSGQDAARTALAFHKVLDLTGVVLTKIDGDSRGGAALSVQHVTGKPVKFLGTSEKLDGFEVFHPERIAERILGMGDIMSLIEDLEKNIDKKKADQLARKVLKGKGFDFNDVRDQLLEIKKMGGAEKMLSKLPAELLGALKSSPAFMADKDLNTMVVLINSMTNKERLMPITIQNQSTRKLRIVKGSGCSIGDLNKLLKMYQNMQKMTKKVGNPDGLMKMMNKLKHMMPPNIF